MNGLKSSGIGPSLLELTSRIGADALVEASFNDSLAVIDGHSISKGESEVVIEGHCSSAGTTSSRAPKAD